MDFQNFCKDKWLTYKEFKNLSPKTYLIRSYEDMIKNHKNNILWLTKPRYGMKGNGVKLVRLKDYLKRKRFNFLLQENIIPSNNSLLFNKPHDLRVIVKKKLLWKTYIRYPNKEIRANTSKGGIKIDISINSIPKIIILTSKKINRNLSKKFNMNKIIYTIDFIYFNKDKIYLIDLNFISFCN